MKQDVRSWSDSMLIRFANLEDSCCAMGKSLRPVTNLNKAIYLIELYRKTLANIGARADVQKKFGAGKGNKKAAEEFEFISHLAGRALERGLP